MLDGKHNSNLTVVNRMPYTYLSFCGWLQAQRFIWFVLGDGDGWGRCWEWMIRKVAWRRPGWMSGPKNGGPQQFFLEHDTTWSIKNSVFFLCVPHFQSHYRRFLKLFFQKLYHTVKAPNKRTALFDMSWCFAAWFPMHVLGLGILQWSWWPYQHWIQDWIVYLSICKNNQYIHFDDVLINLQEHQKKI